MKESLIKISKKISVYNRDEQDLKNWSQKLKTIQNGANVHNINNLVSIINGYLELIKGNKEIDKKSITDVKKKCEQLYKRYK